MAGLQCACCQYAGYLTLCWFVGWQSVGLQFVRLQSTGLQYGWLAVHVWFTICFVSLAAHVEYICDAQRRVLWLLFGWLCCSGPLHLPRLVAVNVGGTKAMLAAATAPRSTVSVALSSQANGDLASCPRCSLPVGCPHPPGCVCEGTCHPPTPSPSPSPAR